jgi:hypothetical protein
VIETLAKIEVFGLMPLLGYRVSLKWRTFLCCWHLKSCCTEDDCCMRSP